MIAMASVAIFARQPEDETGLHRLQLRSRDSSASSSRNVAIERPGQAVGQAREQLRYGCSGGKTNGLPAALCAALVAALAFASRAFAYVFPPLTGRVVDQANIISEPTASRIAAKLAELEAKSGIQLVVATVTSLEGDAIEPYANALFRAWGLGEKGKNNGVLLLVAPNERKARIEVGYGLEGTLTDALSKVIITNAMVPRFKAGDFGSGIERGVEDIITVLSADSSEWQKRPELRVVRKDATLDDLAPFIALGLIVLIFFLLTPPRERGNLLSFLLGMMMSSERRDGYRGGYDGGGPSGWQGGSGGGFSGGGGSSGGGGASGDW